MLVRPAPGRATRVVRRSQLALEFVAEVCRTTTIHGFSHLASAGRHPAERVGWACVIGVAIGCTVAVSLVTLHRYHENPTVISMERNFQEWNISMPAAFICPTTRSIPEHTATLARRLAGDDADDDKVTVMTRYLEALINVTYHNFHLLAPFEQFDYLPQAGIAALLYELKANFTCQLALSTEWDPSLSGISETATVLLEQGFCFAHNTLLSDWSASPALRPGQLTLAEKLARDDLVVSKLDGARYFSLINISSSYDAYWVSRDELPDAGSRPSAAGVNMRSQFYAKLRVVMAQVAAPRVRELAIERRRCRFASEPLPDSTFQIYSFKTCLVDCRARRALQLCACLPFFTPRNATTRECDIRGMLCLAKYADKLIRLDVDSCGCSPSCEVTAYVLPITDIIGSTEFGRRVSWVITGFPTTRYKRDVLFTFSDLLVAFGGTAGLFLGCSLLSLLELVYFFTLRLALFVRSRHRAAVQRVARPATRKRRAPAQMWF